jgi:ribosomal protein L44E
MQAYCPYCKEKVTVRSELHEQEAMQLLKANKRILVRHVGPDGDHVFRTGKATAK